MHLRDEQRLGVRVLELGREQQLGRVLVAAAGGGGVGHYREAGAGAGAEAGTGSREQQTRLRFGQKWGRSRLQQPQGQVDDIECLNRENVILVCLKNLNITCLACFEPFG